jgi:hypothetical protein
MMLDMKARALKYVARGFRVVAMHPVKDGRCGCSKGSACDRPGKHPMTKHGVNDASMDRDQIRAWWTESPDANIGIATGSEAGILVLDIDPRNKGMETLARLKKELGPLPDTVTVITGGGGRHLVFQHPIFPVRKDTSGKVFGPGIDVLSDGCIVIAPPSVHASGNHYRCVKGKAYRNREPAPFPQPWLDRLRGDAPAQAKADSVPAAQVDGLITEGRRNNYLTSFAGTLQRSGASPEALSAALSAENSAKCSPPLDAAEVKGIVVSITRYPALPGGGGDAAEQLMQLVLDRHFDGGKHLMLSTDGRFWHYDGRLWRDIPDQWVSGKVLEIIQANPPQNQKTASLLGQVLTLLKAKLAVKDDALSFVVNPPPVINCANGEVWISPDGTIDLRPHRPESHLRHCLDVTYDPDAVCPAYDKALLEIFAKADNPKAMVRHWNEVFGYVIQPKRNIPAIADLSHGMRRRLMVLPFDRIFTEEEKDPDLFERIWANELPGVLNQALRGYKRLLERGTKFKFPNAVKQATTAWLQQANPLPAFLKARCTTKQQGRCLVKDFYAHYSVWTKDMGYTLTQTQQTVTRNLAHLGYGTKKTNQGMAIIGLVLAVGKGD